VLTFYRLEEALSWLQSQTGHVWTDSELFDIASRHALSISAIPPRELRAAVMFYGERGELIVEKQFVFSRTLPCVSPFFGPMGLVRATSIKELWLAGETKCKYVRDDENELVKNGFGLNSPQSFVGFVTASSWRELDQPTVAEFSVTRDNVCLHRDELTKVLKCWRNTRPTLQLLEPIKLETERRTDKTRRADDLSTNERNTLLKLVLGMAMHGFDHDPVSSRSKAPKEIADALADVGLSVTDDTVRKWLKLAAETVIPKKQG
jgi:hypothetical protein